MSFRIRLAKNAPSRIPARVGRSLALQAALFKISEAAHSAPDLVALFRGIHDVIGELIPARNFYVALYEAESDTISFPYYADEHDPATAPRLLRDGRGLTDYVLRSGEPLPATPDDAESLQARGIQLIGTEGLDWLGIPLRTGGRFKPRAGWDSL